MLSSCYFFSAGGGLRGNGGSEGGRGCEGNEGKEGDGVVEEDEGVKKCSDALTQNTTIAFEAASFMGSLA